MRITIVLIPFSSLRLITFAGNFVLNSNFIMIVFRPITNRTTCVLQKCFIFIWKANRHSYMYKWFRSRIEKLWKNIVTQHLSFLESNTMKITAKHILLNEIRVCRCFWEKRRRKNETQNCQKFLWMAWCGSAINISSSSSSSAAVAAEPKTTVFIGATVIRLSWDEP